MLNIRWIRENPEMFDKGLARRGLDSSAKIILDLDQQHRKLQTDLQEALSLRNTLAKQNADARKAGQDTTSLNEQASKLKETIASLEQQEKDFGDKLKFELERIPNIPHESVPDGKDETANVLLRTWEKPTPLSFSPKQHFELGENLGMMDFEIAANMSGTRFVILKGLLAKLERAVSQFMLDLHTETFGYTEVSPPLLANRNAIYGVGQLPKFEHDLFQTTDGRFLIPSAEVTLTNLVLGQIVDQQKLPMRVTAHTACFRSEAGAAGRDTRGMIRLHQFNKVELVSITTPEQSQEEHERMTNAAEEVLKQLKLPYRVMLLCSGDMGFSSQKTYDLEVWLPGANAYREISSCSNCGDFQARRMNARFKPQQKENQKSATEFLHTLNGSGLAVGRTVVAILENYQNEDGSIRIPDVLQPYMSGLKEIR